MTPIKNIKKASFSPPSNPNVNTMARYQKATSEYHYGNRKLDVPKASPKSVRSIDEKLQKLLNLDLEPEKEVSRSFYSHLLDAEMKKLHEREKTGNYKGQHKLET